MSAFDREINRDGKTLADELVELIGDLAESTKRIADALEGRSGEAGRLTEVGPCREGEAEAVRWCVTHRRPMYGQRQTCGPQ